MLNAAGAIAYVALVGTIMQNGNKFFGPKDTALTPVAVLSLFVLSASVTGSLVLGKPVLMYLDGQKKEAVKMFIFTVCWLALATVILFLCMAKW